MKPPVVVIARHCKTNQCWIAVRFKKIPSVAKISQTAARSARMRCGSRVPLAAPGECLCSSYIRAPLSKVLSHALAVGSCDGFGTPEQAPRPVPPAVERRALQPPINGVGDRAINGPHAFPLNAGLDNNPTNRDF